MKKSDRKADTSAQRRLRALGWISRIVGGVAAFLIALSVSGMLNGFGQPLHTITIVCVAVLLLVLEGAWSAVARDGIRREAELESVVKGMQGVLTEMGEFVRKIAEETGSTVTVTVTDAEGKTL